MSLTVGLMSLFDFDVIQVFIVLVSKGVFVLAACWLAETEPIDELSTEPVDHRRPSRYLAEALLTSTILFKSMFFYLVNVFGIHLISNIFSMRLIGNVLVRWLRLTSNVFVMHLCI